MELYDKCLEAKEYIASKIDAKDAIAIVLGSGLGPIADIIENPIEIAYQDIPHFLKSTVSGHAGKIVFGNLFGKKVICFSGRWHLYEGYSVQDITMYIRVLKMLEAKCLILTNAAGGVNFSYEPGTLMLVDDIINFTCQNPLIGQNDDRLGTRFPDMVHALSQDLKDVSMKAAEKLNIDLRKGVYMGFIGPSFETPAEIRFARNCGADACGMSTVPEVIVARHAQLPCMCISLITNLAAGMSGKELTHEEVKETSEIAAEKFKNLVLEIIKDIDKVEK